MTDPIIAAYKKVQYITLLQEARRRAPERFNAEYKYDYFEWLKSLDKSYRVRITKYVNNFIQNERGSKKNLDLTQYDDYIKGEELWELRIGSKNRVYYKYIDNNSIVILYGGSKLTQSKAGASHAKQVSAKYPNLFDNEQNSQVV